MEPLPPPPIDRDVITSVVFLGLLLSLAGSKLQDPVLFSHEVSPPPPKTTGPLLSRTPEEAILRSLTYVADVIVDGRQVPAYFGPTSTAVFNEMQGKSVRSKSQTYTRYYPSLKPHRKDAPPQ